jgi:hypothetical protein
MSQESHKTLLKHWWAERWPPPAPAARAGEPEKPAAGKRPPGSSGGPRRGSILRADPERSREGKLPARGDPFTTEELAEAMPELRALIERRRAEKAAAAQTAKAKP